jgi:SAM-dependent methyltransferase
LEVLSQKGQYEKGGIGKWFRDFRDHKIFSLIKENCHRLIDLGCGAGITLEKLAMQFPEKKCFGIDLGKENLAACRSSRLPVVCGDVCQLGLKKESADCCLLLDVIEHLTLPEKVLEEIFRILKPGGTLILIFPNDRTFFLARLFFFKFKEAFYDAGHVKQWHPKEMKSLLREKGFHIDHSMNLPLFLWPISLYHLIQARKEAIENRRDRSWV